MNPIESAARHLDRAQQRHTAAAFVFAVLKKYGDDNGGVLVSNIAYAGIMALFPLILLLVTALGIVVGSDTRLQARVDHTVLVQFPVVGNQLMHNVHAMKRKSAVGMVLGIAGLIYGSMSISQAGIYAMDRVWNLPGTRQPDFVHRLGRSAAFLGVLGVGFLSTTVAAGLGAVTSRSQVAIVIGLVVALALNFLQYLLSFRVLTARSVSTRRLVPGAGVGAVAWTILQSVGTYLVGHNLRHDTAIYGVFGVVIGLLAWIYLGARITLYAAEVNTVLYHRLWPRGLVQPPLTSADQTSMRLHVQGAVRRPEEAVQISFTTPPATAPGARDAHGIALDAARMAKESGGTATQAEVGEEGTEAPVCDPGAPPPPDPEDQRDHQAEPAP